MDSEENAEESTTTDGASQLEQIREIVKKAIAEMRGAGLLAYSQGGFGDGGDFEVHLWRNDAAKSLHGGPYVVTIKGSNRNQSEEQPFMDDEEFVFTTEMTRRYIVPNWYVSEHFTEMEGWSKARVEKFKKFLADSICAHDGVKQYVREVIVAFDEEYPKIGCHE